LHFTALPTLFLSGFTAKNPNEKVYLGSEAAIVTSNPDARATFIEFGGAGLSHISNCMKEEEQKMAVLGARMLEPQLKVGEAADSASIRRKGEESTLSSIALCVSLGITMALQWFAEFNGGKKTDIKKYEINRNFVLAGMDPAKLTALVSAWQQGAISDQVLFYNLKAGEIIDEATTLEEEQARRNDRAAANAPPESMGMQQGQRL